MSPVGAYLLRVCRRLGLLKRRHCGDGRVVALRGGEDLASLGLKHLPSLRCHLLLNGYGVLGRTHRDVRLDALCPWVTS